jgi:hypothetical protein
LEATLPRSNLAPFGDLSPVFMHESIYGQFVVKWEVEVKVQAIID